MSPCDKPRSARYDLITSPMLTLGFSLGMGGFPLTGAYLTSNPQTTAKVIFNKCSWQEHAGSCGYPGMVVFSLTLRAVEPSTTAFNPLSAERERLGRPPHRIPAWPRACPRTAPHRRALRIPA